MLYLLCLALLFASAVVGQSNPEVERLFNQDQKDRQNWTAMTSKDWQKLAGQDATRRKRLGEILRAGGLRTGEDYERAAFIYQHGATAEDYLLAHALAMTSVAKGNPGGRWIAAATLDRYLLTIGRPQVFGTQLTSKEPFDRELMPDSVRLANCVPSVADRARQVEAVEQHKKLPMIIVCGPEDEPAAAPRRDR